MIATIIIVGVAVVILIFAFQLITNSIISELKPNSGTSVRDVIDRLEAAILGMQATIHRLEQGQVVIKATGERLEEGTTRLEEAGVIVATELAAAQIRAAEVAGGAPGAAADAAVLPSGVVPKRPTEVIVVNQSENPVNTEVGNTPDKPVPTLDLAHKGKNDDV